MRTRFYYVKRSAKIVSGKGKRFDLKTFRNKKINNVNSVESETKRFRLLSNEVANICEHNGNVFSTKLCAYQLSPLYGNKSVE
jgi:hypothetical protein